MLIPRGAPESDKGGLACKLFAMVSNYDDDHVEQDLTGTCSNAMAYCGIRDRLYPDKREFLIKKNSKYCLQLNKLRLFFR